MKRTLIVLSSLTLAVLALSASIGPQALAQRQDYVPPLGNVMLVIQNQHLKLWFAGKSKNWELAGYEVDQLYQSFSDAAALYAGIPATDIATVAGPIAELRKSLEMKNGAQFMKAFNNLTAACNGCHHAIDRKFISIRVPESTPFSNQNFGPVTDSPKH